MLNVVRKTCLTFTLLCLVSTSIPLSAAVAKPMTVTPRTTYPVSAHEPQNRQRSNTTLRDQEQQCQECGQAYYAGAYAPSLRPYVVVGLLLVTAVLAVYFTNRS